MATRVEVSRTDGTKFLGLSDTDIEQDGGNGNGALIVMPGIGWTILDGKDVRGSNQRARCGATGSRLLMQTFPAPGTGQPTSSRFTLLESSGDGFVSRLDGSDEHTLPVGYFIDVVNTDPPTIGNAQVFVAANHPDTAAALSAAEAALEEEEPEEPEDPEA